MMIILEPDQQTNWFQKSGWEALLAGHVSVNFIDELIPHSYILLATCLSKMSRHFDQILADLGYSCVSLCSRCPSRCRCFCLPRCFEGLAEVDVWQWVLWV